MAKAQPIRDKTRVQDLLRILEKDTTDMGRKRYLLFMTGIYTGRRISDIVRLKVGDVRGRESILIVEKKTQKETEIFLPDKLQQAYKTLLAGQTDDDWVFPSDKAGRIAHESRHITTRTAYNYMKSIEEAGRLGGADAHISTHTMRKTFGYHYYKMTKDIATLMGLFNHSSAATTLIYIGIASDEKKMAAKKINRMYD